MIHFPFIGNKCAFKNSPSLQQTTQNPDISQPSAVLSWGQFGAQRLVKRNSDPLIVGVGDRPTNPLISRWPPNLQTTAKRQLAAHFTWGTIKCNDWVQSCSTEITPLAHHPAPPGCRHDCSHHLAINNHALITAVWSHGQSRQLRRICVTSSVERSSPWLSSGDRRRTESRTAGWKHLCVSILSSLVFANKSIG